MTIDPLKFFAVEYSMSLNPVHRRTLRRVIVNNQGNLRKGHSSDFVPIGLFASREEANQNFAIRSANRLRTPFTVAIGSMSPTLFDNFIDEISQ